MAYQIQKVPRISEDLELLGEDGSVELTIHVELSVERIASQYRKVQLEMAKARKMNDVESYGRAVLSLINLVFGEDGMQQLLAYYNGDYVDMSIQILPFIQNRIYPAVERYAKTRKDMIANNVSLNRKQRRQLGL